MDLMKVFPGIKSTLDQIKQELKQEKEPESRKLLLELERTEAELALNTKQYDQAILVLQNALHTTAADPDDSLKCLILMKSTFVKMGSYTRAFQTENLVAALWPRRSQSLNINYGIKKSILMPHFGMQLQAVAERRKEFKESKEKDTFAICSFYNDLGLLFCQQKRYDSAVFCYRLASDLLMLKKTDEKGAAFLDFFRGLINGNLGACYLNMGKVEEAMPLIWSDITSSTRGGYYESAYNAYIDLLKAAILQKNQNMAQTAMDSAQSLLRKHLYSDVAIEIKLLPPMAEYYMDAKQFDKAANAYKRYATLSDSITAAEKQREENNRSIVLNILQHESAQSERDRLLKRIQLEEAREKYFIAYIIAGSMILLTAIFFLAINFHSSRKREQQLSAKNKQIQEQNIKIEQSLKEKEALIREIHHRVKNNLQIITSMLNLQMNLTDDADTHDILSEAKKRIEAIALTHQMLYQKISLENIVLSQYIETLVRQVEASIKVPSINLVLNCPPSNGRINIDIAIPLGLIVNELLTNAYKHAFAGKRDGLITVDVDEAEEFFTISVKDNGRGFEPQKRGEESQTLGMELVNILIEQIDSELTIKSEKETGTEFSFRIKKHN